VMVKDIYPGSSGSAPFSLTNVNGTLYFTAFDPLHGTEVWKSDGTAEGTILLVDTTPYDTGNQAPTNLTAVGDTLYFAATGDLWASDGTTEGSIPVGDYTPSNLTDVNGRLYFTVLGSQLWKSDGTREGTVLVRGGFSSLFNLRNING